MSTTLTSGIDPASFSAVTAPAQDLFRYVNGPWIDMYRLPDDRSRYGSFDKTRFTTSSKTMTVRPSSHARCSGASST